MEHCSVELGLQITAKQIKKCEAKKRQGPLFSSENIAGSKLNDFLQYSAIPRAGILDNTK